MSRSAGLDGRLHSGLVATNLGNESDSPKWLGIAMKLLKGLLGTPEKGATTSVYLATKTPLTQRTRPAELWQPVPNQTASVPLHRPSPV